MCFLVDFIRSTVNSLSSPLLLLSNLAGTFGDSLGEGQGPLGEGYPGKKPAWRSAGMNSPTRVYMTRTLGESYESTMSAGLWTRRRAVPIDDENCPGRALVAVPLRGDEIRIIRESGMTVAGVLDALDGPHVSGQLPGGEADGVDHVANIQVPRELLIFGLALRLSEE